MDRQTIIRRSSYTVCILFVLLLLLGFGRTFSGYEAILFSLVVHLASLTRDKRVSGGTIPAMTQICCFFASARGTSIRCGRAPVIAD